jgi:hypothetical protein
LPVRFVGRDYGEMRKAEVGHGAGHGANVEWVARRNENDVDGLRLERQEMIVAISAGQAAAALRRMLAHARMRCIVRLRQTTAKEKRCLYAGTSLLQCSVIGAAGVSGGNGELLADFDQVGIIDAVGFCNL